MECERCHSKDLIENDARAELVCENCGFVCEANDFQYDTEFQEMENGKIVAIGNIITIGPGATKQHTLNKAQKRIDDLCSKLFLTKKLASFAFEIFKSALKVGLTRGRKAKTMAGACVYLATRLKRQSIMLLDISDKINVNVYVLGKVYNVIKENFGQKVQDIDPCLFIERFANELEFGDQREAVSLTALKLLQRMKKDWISTGRRPCGITAAALLISARIHHFDRDYEDVARIAGISQQTAKKRLEEWSETATAGLTLHEFKTIDYEEEYDPPSFYKQKNSQNGCQGMVDSEMSEEQFEKLKEDIRVMSQRIEEAEKQGAVEGRCFSSLVESVENGVIDIGDLIGNLQEGEEGEAEDEDELLGRREILKQCINPKFIGDLFQTASKEEFPMDCETNDKLHELPVTLPLIATDVRWSEGGMDQFDMTGIDDDELEKTYISSREESVKKLRWWYSENKDFYKKKKESQANKEEKKKEEQNGRKTRSKRPKRTSAFLEEASQLLQEIKPGMADEAGESSQNDVYIPPMKTPRISPVPSEDEQQGDDRRYADESEGACFKYETGDCDENSANSDGEYTGEPQYEFDEP